MINVLPGDNVLMHGRGLVESGIRFAERHRYPDDPELSEWNHGAIVVDHDGGLIEARSRGLQRANLNWYRADRMASFTVLRPPWEDRAHAMDAVRYAESRLAEHEGYGFIAVASVALAWFTQTRLRFGYAKQAFCTGFMSECDIFGAIDMGDDPGWNSPADVMRIARAGKWQRIA